MRNRSLLGAIVLAAAGIGMAATGAWGFDNAKYPEIRGAWERPGTAQWDPTKPPGLRQQAPLTPEYQAIFEANLADAAVGGQEYNPQVSCLPAGMPRVMIAYEPLEFIITPEITYMRSDHLAQNRRIYTDGRDWPEKITPSFDGYSIGKWVEGAAMAVTEHSKWRPAASRARELSTPAGCPCTLIIRPLSRSAFHRSS